MRRNYTSCFAVPHEFKSFILKILQTKMLLKFGNFPNFGGHARQHVRGFGALAQALEGTATPFF